MKFVNFLKSHKAWLATVALGAIGFLTPSIDAYVAGHPKSAVLVATLWGVITSFVKSPNQTTGAK